MFQDNKASRASHLEQELADLDFETFTSIDGYCNHIKSLADRLADVDAPIPDTRLILKMTAGLPEAYAGTVDFIQNQEPLPTFESCRSRLKLADRTIKNRLAKESDATSRPTTALLSTTGSSHQTESSASRPSSKNSKHKPRISKNSNNKARNSGGPAHNSGSANAKQWPPSWTPWTGQWPRPPCPYPASSWASRPPAPSSNPKSGGPGILGQHPQAYSAINPSPTDIEAAMHMLANLGKSDSNYYMDTGATAHMTADQDGGHTNET
ncbi:uncharacterized protein LOC110730802 [Chenopodium quinoa]|uniref:uncharacterized protein LOC110730802 n=1 Tax=Chenopodium quinoa TaxID=63459 RepID=UPI000B774C93|nr:uncharacterized protein LOC110730802 [Chenopodium quinoa]